MTLKQRSAFPRVCFAKRHTFCFVGGREIKLTEETLMNANLTNERKIQLEQELEDLEKRLITPARTQDDLIRHMEILKELYGV